jgi:hypothetical protein
MSWIKNVMDAYARGGQQERDAQTGRRETLELC